MFIGIRFIFFLVLLMAAVKTAWADLPYYPIQFPRDDFAHYENVPYGVDTMTEWWYYNGRFTTKDGRQFGYYLNYSYIQLEMGNKKLLVPLFMIQMTDVQNQKVYGRTIIPKIDDCHFSTTQMDLAIGKDVTLKRIQNTFLLVGTVPGEKPTDPTLSFSIQTTPVLDPLLINKTGYIDMFDNSHSYYYSYTRLDTTGYIQIGNDKIEIDPKQSLMWMDHQWGDFLIIPKRHQWFFTLIQLENGLDMMMAVPYDKEKHQYDEKKGYTSIILPDHSRVYTKQPRLTAHIQPGEKYTQNYEIAVPEINLQLALKSLAPGQDINWISESDSDVTGLYKGFSVKGSANVESTVMYPGGK